jgi:serine/threonine protein phosphatase PrpC
MIDDGEIESVLSGSKSLEEKAAILIALANRAGGKDNISVILIDTSRDTDGKGARL